MAEMKLADYATPPEVGVAAAAAARAERQAMKAEVRATRAAAARVAAPRLTTDSHKASRLEAKLEDADSPRVSFSRRWVEVLPVTVT